jgi:hypothetical protein
MATRMGEARARFDRWLEKQTDFPQGVARDAGVSTEAVRRWKRDGAWPSMEAALALAVKRKLDLNSLLRAD